MGQCACKHNKGTVCVFSHPFCVKPLSFCKPSNVKPAWNKFSPSDLQHKTKCLVLNIKLTDTNRSVDACWESEADWSPGLGLQTNSLSINLHRRLGSSINWSQKNTHHVLLRLRLRWCLQMGWRVWWLDFCICATIRAQWVFNSCMVSRVTSDS